jgi:hypothetical protein
MCVEIHGVKILTSFGGLRCFGFINPIGVVADVRKQRVAVRIGHI